MLTDSDIVELRKMEAVCVETAILYAQKKIQSTTLLDLLVADMHHETKKRLYKVIK